MYTISLAEVDKSNTEVGTKAAYLGDLIKSGFQVPQGFIITSEAFRKFLQNNKLDDKIQNILSSLNVENYHELKQSSTELENLILSSKIPQEIMISINKYYEELSFGQKLNINEQALDMIKAGRDKTFVSVRPSLLTDKSTSGQLKSYLNVYGSENLLEAVKRVWSSIYSPQGLFYRAIQNIPEDINIVVQKMINSEKSGVIFTTHPITNEDKFLIEATWGLNQALTSGIVTPDSYLIDKTTGNIEKRISKKTLQIRKDQIGKTVRERVPDQLANAPVLDEKEISKLIEIAKSVEAYYGPQIIEWCQERGRIFLLQIKPLVPTIQNEEQQENGKLLYSGYPTSSGFAKGRVKIVRSFEDMESKEGEILVLKNVPPDITPFTNKIKAIISEEGSICSLLVLRELGIPCLLIPNATTVLQDRQEIVLNAFKGTLSAVESDTVTEVSNDQKELAELPGSDSGEIITATEIKVNISHEQTITSEVDGVGLLKIELAENPFHLSKENPEELIRRLEESIGRVAKVFYPKPVWYRSFDIKTNELADDDTETEQNPLFGWHGIRRSLDDPETFKCELQALKNLFEKGVNNISLLLPFVSTVDEFRRAKAFVDFPLKVGIVIEVPSVALDIESFCKEAAFVSIGINNLAQFTLGVDKGNPNVSKLYSEKHPTVLKLLKNIIDVCKSYNIEVSICEGFNVPDLVELLVEYGIDSISTEPENISKVKTIVARTERRLLLGKLRK